MKINQRHISKTISWRLIASADTMIISTIILGGYNLAITLGIIETFTKLFLYFLHEKFWFILPKIEAKYRHLIKTFSWRLIGTLDTFLIASIISNDYRTGFVLISFESISKIILYYFHEKIWYNSKFGLNE